MVASRLLEAYRRNTLSQCKLIIQSTNIDEYLNESVEYEHVFDNAFHSMIHDGTLYIYICMESAITNKSCELPTTDKCNGTYYFEYHKNDKGVWKFDTNAVKWETVHGETDTYAITINSINVNGIDMTNRVFLMDDPDEKAKSLAVVHKKYDGSIERTITIDPTPVTKLNSDDGLSQANIMNYILNIVY